MARLGLSALYGGAACTAGAACRVMSTLVLFGRELDPVAAELLGSIERLVRDG